MDTIIIMYGVTFTIIICCILCCLYFAQDALNKLNPIKSLGIFDSIASSIGNITTGLVGSDLTHGVGKITDTIQDDPTSYIGKELGF